MKKITLLALACCILTAGQAFAASGLYLGLQLGPEFITDDDGYDDAIAYGIYGGYNLDQLLSLEASLTRSNHDPEHNDFNDIDNTALLFGPRLNAQMARGVNLYGGAGLGMYFLDWDDDSETETGLYIGAGVDFPIQSNVNLGLDLKYHAMFDSDDTIDSDLVTLMVRVGFNL
ncbi:MAG: hypothetical protein BWX71_00124 [Deltaproteobacteria bacterium ADurb.Bin072]|nr:MAG: hypothetical protein BWX71_00124 [Deltaproteobacteria bacterium ADurb.Bin072]